MTSYYYLALEPDETFSRVVSDYKSRARMLVGEQLFLADPPHTTLYLAAFDDEDRVRQETANVAAAIATAPPLDVRGWHVFYGDKLTGNNTLVFALTDDCVEKLRTTQQLVVSALSPLRNIEMTRARYQHSYEGLPANQQESVDSYGFPFVGDIWQAHVTIASFDQSRWDEVWKAFKNEERSYEAVYGAFKVYRLDEQGRSQLQASYDLPLRKGDDRDNG